MIFWLSPPVNPPSSGSEISSAEDFAPFLIAKSCAADHGTFSHGERVANRGQIVLPGTPRGGNKDAHCRRRRAQAPKTQAHCQDGRRGGKKKEGNAE